MQKIIFIQALIVFFFTFPGIVYSSLKFESTALPQEEKTILAKEAEGGHLIPKAVVPDIRSDRSQGIEDEESVKNILRKYEIILSREKKLEKIVPIEFNRIICFIDLARASRVRSGGKNLMIEEKEYLNKSLLLIDKLLKLKILKKALVGQLYFFQGVSYLDLEDKVKSRISFEKAIETYSMAKFVPSLSLYLADIDYDSGKLDKAMEGYKKFYSQMNDDEKSFSNYKMAWINLNQSHIEEATKLFFKIIRESNSKSTVQDSVLSLSMALSEKYDEDFIIQEVNKNKIKDQDKLRILWGVYENFVRIPGKEKFQLWETIAKYEKDPESILKLISRGLQSIELGDGIEKEFIMTQRIHNYLNENKNKLKKANAMFLGVVGDDLERLISKSLGKYQKKKGEINYKILRLAIESYLMLDIHKRQIDVMTLSLELLIERKEEVGVMGLCKIILTDSRYLALKNRAKLLVLLNFENKFLGDQVSNQKKFFTLVNAYLKDETADQWQDVADKYYEYLVKANMYNEADNLASRFYRINPSEEHFLKLITIKYELKKCSDILQLLANKEKLDKNQLDYKRECHLQIAEDAKKMKEVKGLSVDKAAASSDNYQANILEFIRLAEGKKRNAAIADYLTSVEKNYLESSGSSIKIEYAKLQELLDKIFFKERFAEEVFPTYQKEILRLIEVGEFKKALIYLNGCELAPSCKQMIDIGSQLDFAIRFDADKNIDNKILNIKNSEFYKYLSLLTPESFFALFKNGLTGQSIDPLLIVVASRLGAVDWNNPLYKDLYPAIEKYLSSNEKTFIFYPSWRRYSKIDLPSFTKRHSLSDQDIVYYMNRVHNARKALLIDLPILSIEMQNSILAKAMEVETKMAEIIKLSPIPKSLEKSKINEYQEGLNQLAEEFVTQRSTYNTTLTNIAQQLKMKKDSLELVSQQQLKSPKNVEEWDWGDSSIITDKIIFFATQRNYFQSMFYLDYLFSISKIDSLDYYRKRSGILLLSAAARNKPQPMILYVKDDLVSNKQLTFFDQWQKWSSKK